jgi:hypothetical protein
MRFIISSVVVLRPVKAFDYERALSPTVALREWRRYLRRTITKAGVASWNF